MFSHLLWSEGPDDDTRAKSKLWLLNSLSCNLKVCPRSNRVVNEYRFRDADILPDKFQQSSENDKTSSGERELAVNAQHMINLIRLKNHAGHPSRAKQKSDAHLMTIEDTFSKTYTHATNKRYKRKKRKGLSDYTKWTKNTHHMIIVHG